MTSKLLQIVACLLLKASVALGIQQCSTTAYFGLGYYCPDEYFCCGSTTCCAIWWVVVAAVGGVAVFIGIPIIVCCCKRRANAGTVYRNQQPAVNMVTTQPGMAYGQPQQGYYPPQPGMQGQPQQGYYPPQQGQAGNFQSPPAYGEEPSKEQKYRH